MLKILDKECTPKKGSKYSACVDLFAREDIVIGAGETVLVPLGVKIDLVKLISRNRYATLNSTNVHTNKDDENFLASHQLNLHIRSSMSAKHGLIISNGTGIIDLDYDGEIMICLHKPIKNVKIIADLETEIKKGQPIAQISLIEHKSYLFGVDTEDKRTGGFGSTGTN